MVDTPHSGIAHFELNGNPEVPINAAFDDLDENASGYIFKTITAAHDFTTDLDADGDSLWLRHKTIEFLGTLTADEVITIPLAEQHKIVWNNTAGGFSLTFEANAGSPTLSTVTVPNGAWAHLAVNSLGHVFNTLDTLGDLTISGGTLVAATVDINGGTVDGTVIGGASAAAGSFTTLAASGLISADGGQIAFPATQSASADANTLDDYEEGTFTPNITFATPGDLSVTHSTELGRYTKIGNIVFFTARVITSVWTHTTASGTFRLTGLPFTVSSSPTVTWVCTAHTHTAVLANIASVMGQPVGGQTYMQFQAIRDGSGPLTFNEAVFPSGSNVTIETQGYYAI